ncbi:hypothetical protein MFIFM68171_08408 [Madurella fahalii]|uniref:C2H2-type domain-containing protein n=1 Tax=Madurella fahalii TaxID=1157608 RepID=A0ABQ0GKC0_9PEZI
MYQSAQHRGSVTQECRLCNKSFKTREALTSHAAAKRHPHCKPCKRVFISAAALDQHRRDSPAHPSPPKGPNSATRPAPGVVPAPTEAPAVATISSIICRGNAYTVLQAAEMAALHALIVPRCHSLHRLRLEKYVLEPDPNLPATAYSAYVRTPRCNPLVPKRKAVVLDCEMVGTSSSRSDDEVVALSLIDFFTGETLVDTLVKPALRVTDWRTGITGISPMVIAVAVASGAAIPVGREGARDRLWEHVDENTIIVGHSVNCDLQALRVLHGKIVDCAIMTAEPVFSGTQKVGRMAGLERLCRELLGLRIRAAAPAAGTDKHHDSLEDVLAVRELVMWCLRNPRELETWAAKNWAPGKQGRTKKTKKKKKSATGGSSSAAVAWVSSDDDDDGVEIERWEDVVDWDTWPKSPPDYSD